MVVKLIRHCGVGPTKLPILGPGTPIYFMYITNFHKITKLEPTDMLNARIDILNVSTDFQH